MMGSLLVVQGGQFAFGLPRGEPCHDEDEEEPNGAAIVTVKDFKFDPDFIEVASGSMLTFDFQEPDHTVMTVSTTMGATPISINNGAGDADAISPTPQQKITPISGMPGAEINYQCGIHLAGMTGTIKIV
jgi:plastocyanin